MKSRAGVEAAAARLRELSSAAARLPELSSAAAIRPNLAETTSRRIVSGGTNEFTNVHTNLGEIEKPLISCKYDSVSLL